MGVDWGDGEEGEGGWGRVEGGYEGQAGGPRGPVSLAQQGAEVEDPATLGRCRPTGAWEVPARATLTLNAVHDIW